MGLAEVSSTLWRQRELLELLLFKLEEEQVLLTSGRTRWLARATREVEVVLEEIRRAELLRALPGAGRDEHAVETAMARLRTALGAPKLIQTVVKRGYRLALDPAADSKYADVLSEQDVVAHLTSGATT